MAKQQPIERARDELFSHIHRCGVLKATPADQDSWMTETMGYLAERYPDLGEKELFHLKAVGLQFCKPVISRIKTEEPKEGNGLGGDAPSDAPLQEAARPDAAPPEVQDAAPPEVQDAALPEVQDAAPQEVQDAGPQEAQDTAPPEAQDSAPQEIAAQEVLGEPVEA